MDTTTTELRFHTSDLKKSINPNPQISQSIEELEKFLFDHEFVDESQEIKSRTIQNSICYKKQGIEILSIFPEKSTFSIRLSGNQWDISPFLQFSIKMNFIIDNTPSWKLLDVETIEMTKLKEAVKESIKPSDNLKQVLKYNLAVLKSYFRKSDFIIQLEQKLMEQVLDYFWKGEMDQLPLLYNQFIQLETDKFKQFIKKWEDVLDYYIEIDPQMLELSMNVNRSELFSIINNLERSLEQSCKNYIHSIKNLWFDYEMIQDKEHFHQNVEEMRSSIVETRDFINDMSNLLSKEELDPILTIEQNDKGKDFNAIDGNKNINQEDEMKSLLIKNTTLDKIIFLDKSYFNKNAESIFTMNENKLNQLVNCICSEKHSQQEMKNLIKIIFEICSKKDFAIRDRVNILFKGKYDEENELKDFAYRHDVKRLFVKSTLDNVFDDLMEHLIKKRIINEIISVVQYKQQKKILFNYNVGIYDLNEPLLN